MAKQAKPKKTRGRPLLYKTAAALQEKVDEYFTYCDNRIVEINVPNKTSGTIEVIGVNKPEPYTWPGLAYHLGFADRQSLLDYGKREAFSCTVTRAKLKIESQRNLAALEGQQDCKFAQFDLKNNFGWKDKQEHEVSGAINVHFDERAKNV